MAVQLSDVRVGKPIRFGGISVFPIFTARGNGNTEYVLAEEAIATDSVSVTEVSEDGSVPDLLVENRGDTRVLFLEGEELIGAKQNRILNLSVLIAAHSKSPVPVSCVEQGRWQYRSRKFGSGRHSPSRLRRILKRSVHSSLRTRGETPIGPGSSLEGDLPATTVTPHLVTHLGYV